MTSFQKSILITGAVFAVFAVHTDAHGQSGAGAIVAIDEAVGAPSAGKVQSAGGSAGQTRSASSSKTAGKAAGRSTTSKTTTHVTPTAKRVVTADRTNFKGPVLGDKYTFLNFEVVSAVPPTYARAAKNAGAKGLVQVEILVSENGNVINAHARTGNKLLWGEAEAAALASKFNKPTVNGQPARALGFLVYRFGPPSEDDDDE